MECKYEFNFAKSKVTSFASNNADIVGGSSTDININPNIIIRTNESPILFWI
jgi:hypothetical protein